VNVAESPVDDNWAITVTPDVAAALDDLWNSVQATFDQWYRSPRRPEDHGDVNETLRQSFLTFLQLGAAQPSQITVTPRALTVEAGACQLARRVSDARVALKFLAYFGADLTYSVCEELLTGPAAFRVPGFLTMSELALAASENTSAGPTELPDELFKKLGTIEVTGGLALGEFMSGEIQIPVSEEQWDVWFADEEAVEAYTDKLCAAGDVAAAEQTSVWLVLVRAGGELAARHLATHWVGNAHIEGASFAIGDAALLTSMSDDERSAAVIAEEGVLRIGKEVGETQPANCVNVSLYGDGQAACYVSEDAQPQVLVVLL
jgi:hypothetical protein